MGKHSELAGVPLSSVHSVAVGKHSELAGVPLSSVHSVAVGKLSQLTGVLDLWDVLQRTTALAAAVSAR